MNPKINFKVIIPEEVRVKGYKRPNTLPELVAGARLREGLHFSLGTTQVTRGQRLANRHLVRQQAWQPPDLATS